MEYILGLATWVLAIFITKVVYDGIKRKRFYCPITWIAIVVFCISVILFLPIYHLEFGWGFWNCFKTFAMSIHNTIRLYVVDSDYSDIVTFVENNPSWWSELYSNIMALFFILAPLTTFGYVISLIWGVLEKKKLDFTWKKDIYIFSNLNEESIQLAQSLKNGQKNRQMVFTDVHDDGEELQEELISEAQEIGAVLLKTDIAQLKLNKANMTFFIMGPDSDEKMMQAMSIVENYKMSKQNVTLYVFTTRMEYQAIARPEFIGNIKLHRVNPSRSMVEQLLYKEGTVFFDGAVTKKDNQKTYQKISVAILGAGEHGTNMMKSLSWYLQMDGYKSEINMFDIREGVKDRLLAECPELILPEYNGMERKGDAQYDIKIHEGIDVEGDAFWQKLQAIKNSGDLTHVFIALGNDAVNIRVASMMRMYGERLGNKKLVIYAVSKNKKLNDKLNVMKNYAAQEYNIRFIGDTDTFYSEDTVLNSKLENEALAAHKRWGGEESSFWNYEYNYRSSMASVIHLEARKHCNMPGADKNENEMNENEKNRVQVLEHKRWNAYMRAEGYRYSGKPSKDTRNDLGKLHHDLTIFKDLSDEEKEKDSKVSSKS